jgi:hypothetical protein
MFNFLFFLFSTRLANVFEQTSYCNPITDPSPSQNPASAADNMHGNQVFKVFAHSSLE